VFEFASHPSTQPLFTSDEKVLLAKMEQNFVARNHTWNQTNTVSRIERIKQEAADKKMKGILFRHLVGSFGASSVLVLILLLSLGLLSILFLPYNCADLCLDPKMVITLIATSSLILIAAFLMVAFLIDTVKMISLPQLRRKQAS